MIMDFATAGVEPSWMAGPSVHQDKMNLGRERVIRCGDLGIRAGTPSVSWLCWEGRSPYRPPLVGEKQIRRSSMQAPLGLFRRMPEHRTLEASATHARGSCVSAFPIRSASEVIF